MAIAVRAKKDLRCPALDEFDELISLAEKTIEGLSSDALSKIRAHIDLHGMIPNGEKWLRYGVEHSDGVSCPFCSQAISSIPIVDTFKLYFSQAYEEFYAEIETRTERLKEILGPNGEHFDKLIHDNEKDLDFWVTVCELPDRPQFDQATLNDVKASLACVLALLEEKIKNPLSKSMLVDADKVQGSFSHFRDYIRWVSACNIAIQEARLATSTLDVAKAQEILGKLQALQARVSGPIKAELDAWVARDARKTAIEKKKKSEQADLKAYVAKTASEKENSINSLLDLFGARFRISGTKASFVGRDANTDYSIAIGPHVVPAGPKSDTSPSFDTVLSSGDKTTLGLAFFFVQVSSDENLNTSTVILDDPFNSQDIARQWETTSQIRAISGKAAQVIVLSHDPRFLALIEKNAKTTPGTFQILCDDKGVGELRKWSSEDELRDIYTRQSERIREYASAGSCLPGASVESIAKDLRPFLEFYLKVRFPARFTQTAMLDAMVSEIEAAGPTDPMSAQVANMRAINEYGRDNMHGGADAPDPIALRAQCNRIVRIIGAY
jgi:wobble nucleotide-excising tRNase